LQDFLCFEKIKKLKENNINKSTKTSDKELEDLVYITSHDLKEPLRMINSYIQIIEKKYINQLDENAHVYFNFVTDGAKRLQLMIDDLASYSQILRNGYKFEYIEINPLVNKIKNTVQNQFHDKNPEILIDNLPQCYCNPDLIEILFKHLLNNSLKFNTTKPKVSIRYKKDLLKPAFEIEDNGIGIDKQYKDDIFKVFRKLHTINEYQGSGIGLAICKKIVEKHNGKIWFTKSKSGGTIFSFTLSPNKGIN